MKNYVVLIFIIVFSFNLTALAQSNIVFVGGLTYNNLLYSTIKQGQIDNNFALRESLNEGLGYYGEAIYWPVKRFGVGIGVDQVTAKWEDTIQGIGRLIERRYTRQLVGPYTKVIYKLNRSTELGLSCVYYYYSDYRYETKYIDNYYKTGRGLGFLLGTKNNHSITDNLSIVTSLNYRVARIDLRKEYNSYTKELVANRKDDLLYIQGLRASMGITYKF
ncbi:hypothetical protein Halha_1611 [Halobacteroides halobius DSM 5150]|uniref:Outer membrane protein beta-barrel domain-containing protein n=1 Tax=Halobacteroides halobius (strain ATCC 35273 / DSM 5150 / MD-1) TaxID=748449 RepID=L0KAZ9_HALHC|nr:hypothetical protein [Halobacteroides halobius]AGB41549.1 hypothetical protein Halha_1611 [Halobacteroides halobius DSM 5150]